MCLVWCRSDWWLEDVTVCLSGQLFRYCCFTSWGYVAHKDAVHLFINDACNLCVPCLLIMAYDVLVPPVMTIEFKLLKWLLGSYRWLFCLISVLDFLLGVIRRSRFIYVVVYKWRLFSFPFPPPFIHCPFWVKKMLSKFLSFLAEPFSFCKILALRSCTTVFPWCHKAIPLLFHPLLHGNPRTLWQKRLHRRSKISGRL